MYNLYYFFDFRRKNHSVNLTDEVKILKLERLFLKKMLKYDYFAEKRCNKYLLAKEIANTITALLP